MTIYYLMVKTHKITGLRYLCKTTQDPYKYRGSGVYWKLHCKKYGSDHDTEIIKECDNLSDFAYWGLYYSDLWNVVGSNEWANIIPEDGGTEDAGKMGAAIQKNSHWVNNGSHEMMILKSILIPNGYSKGRIPSKRKGKPNLAAKGLIWWNNGIISKMAENCPGIGFSSGRLKDLKYAERYYQNPNHCEWCESVISYERKCKKTCSDNCATEWRRDISSRPRRSRLSKSQ